MRADRLIALLMLLQERGRMTAPRVAEMLEVSPRTVLRDVEALAFAGVPITTVRGAEGGIELREGFRTELTGLNFDEAQWLLLAGLPQLAASLGVEAIARSARHKLLHALDPEHRSRAVSLEDWLYVDVGQASTRPPHDRLSRMVKAITQCLKVRIGGADGSERVVAPLGLVASGEGWSLIAETGQHREAIVLEEIASLRVTGEHFERPTEVSLAEEWDASRAG